MSKKKIVFQGEPGANSHLAISQAYPDAEAVPCATFEDAFTALSARDADLGMIPIENSVAGRVADIHHLMPNSKLHIIAEHFMPVQHQLLGVKGAKLEDIKTVESHVHALGQCRKIIRKLGIKPIVAADTAGSAREIAERGDKTCAAIATKLAAEIYGLDILAENVEDEAHNTTRFIVLSREKKWAPRDKGKVVTTFVFRVKNVPAALYKAMGGFATNGINMTKLESYMIEGNFFATQFYAGGAAVALSATAGLTQQRQLFDSHCHIIDHRFPIVANQGYTPPHFPLENYLAQARPLGVMAGAVVSGSFQAEDQTYLMDILPKLGPAWVGVTQIPNDYPDAEIARLGKLGVRAVRFNVFRGRIDSVDDIVALATRVHSVAGWHSEIYADAAALAPHVDKLSKLPQLCVDHLGMTEAGVPVLLDLVAAGCKVKATGFGRVKLDVPKTLEAVARKNPNALVFGTDIPSTRAARPFEAADIDLVERVLGQEFAQKAFWDNPLALYRVKVA
jgi:prephenate dehydratase